MISLFLKQKTNALTEINIFQTIFERFGNSNRYTKIYNVHKVYSALDYILEGEIASIQIKKNECNCNNTPIQLPCCHYLLTHKTESIEIPIEYLRLKCNYVREKKNELTKSEGEITQTPMEEVNLDLNKAIEELNKVDTVEAQHFRNEIAYSTFQFLKYGYKQRKYRRSTWHEKSIASNSHLYVLLTEIDGRGKV